MGVPGLWEQLKPAARAVGEAEAELAYLNRVGIIDGILSDDVDNFLFGAITVIRNPSNNLSGNLANPALNIDGKIDEYHTHVYRLQDITEHPDVSFTRGDMIFIALCSGGDYDTTGLTGCGPDIAKGLVRYGFGRALYEAAKNLPHHELDAFLHKWRNEIRHELWTDSKGYIGSKRRALALSLPDSFPDITILLSYVHPLTLEWSTAHDDLDPTWAKEANLAKLASTCQLYFGWTESLMKRLRANIWHGAVLRILRRGILDLEEKGRRGEFVQSTPTTNGKFGAEGTPSKLITEYFSSMTFNPVEDDDDDHLITGITRTRTHTSTNGILEYRLQIRPRQLVRLAESELRNRHRAEGGSEKDGTEKELRVWMPASIVRMAEPRLVEEFEQRENTKRLKKVRKRTKNSPAKRKPEVWASEDEQPDVSKSRPRLNRRTRTAESAVVCEEQDSDTVGPNTTTRVHLVMDSDGSSDDELPTFQRRRAALAKGSQTGESVKDFLPTKWVDPLSIDSPARVVRDLTKNKGKAVDNSQTDQNNPFLPKAIGRTSGQALLALVAEATTRSLHPNQRTLSAAVHARQMSGGRPGSSRTNPHNLESTDDVYRPFTSSKSQATEQPDSGNTRSLPELRPQPFPLALWDEEPHCPSTPLKIQAPRNSDIQNSRTHPRVLPEPSSPSFERPLPRRRRNSDHDSDCEPPLTKSPRKSRNHTSPRTKSSTIHDSSPTPSR
ncbi:hypothetical protein MSAN_00814300 [Mycena sanguinolenta]|uniref:XPG-I domain-containing protein n=1 Tax=Mycena sanguinolenta TaxID=230812 RepID=A0A8H7DCX2_9AGAR|nr:hypothetical protein MSAN_00814300 [Mycena sanguinolenta]